MNSLLEIATALLFVVGCMNVQFAEGGVDVNEIYSIDRKELDENNRVKINFSIHFYCFKKLWFSSRISNIFYCRRYQ